MMVLPGLAGVSARLAAALGVALALVVPVAAEIMPIGGGGGGVSGLTAWGCATLNRVPYMDAATTTACSQLERTSATVLTLLSGQYQVPSGTLTAPTYSFTDESGLGWYRFAAGHVALVPGAANSRPMFGLYPRGTPGAAAFTAELSLHEKEPGAAGGERMFDTLMSDTHVTWAVHRTSDALAFLPIRLGEINAAGAFTERARLDLPNSRLDLGAWQLVFSTVLGTPQSGLRQDAAGSLSLSDGSTGHATGFGLGTTTPKTILSYTAPGTDRLLHIAGAGNNSVIIAGDSGADFGLVDPNGTANRRWVSMRLSGTTATIHRNNDAAASAAIYATFDLATDVVTLGSLSVAGLTLNPGTGDVTITAGEHLITGGLMQWISEAEPACNATTRGSVVYVAGGAGVLDTFRICRKDAGDAYAFVTLF